MKTTVISSRSETMTRSPSQKNRPRLRRSRTTAGSTRALASLPRTDREARVDLQLPPSKKMDGVGAGAGARGVGAAEETVGIPGRPKVFPHRGRESRTKWKSRTARSVVMCACGFGPPCPSHARPLRVNITGNVQEVQCQGPERGGEFCPGPRRWVCPTCRVIDRLLSANIACV